jgi:hypothetical protein
MSGKRAWFAYFLSSLAFLAPAAFAGLSFPPDVTFRGSTLAGWHTLGSAEWSAQDGVVIGKANSGGGWLVLDRSFEDVGLHVSFRSAGSKTGILLRVEKTADGFKGVYVDLNEGAASCYRLTLDQEGRELSREPLRRAGGMIRIAPPPAPAAPPRAGSGPGRRPDAPRVALPIERPSTALRPGEWNEVEILLDANIVRVLLNEGGGAGGAADEDTGKFGPLALFAGGSGEVRFKDIAYKDLAVKSMPAEIVSPRFRMQRVNDMYYAWSAAAADFNRDGVMDVVAGPYIYFGPDFTKSREIFPASSFNPSKEFSEVGGQHAFDYTGDGWPDILIAPPYATLYVNPKGESRRWDKYRVVSSMQTELSIIKDIDGDKTPELIYAADGYVRYAKPDPADATKPWIVHSVSERGYATAHGIGAGDINGDGRVDIVNPYGWWEQPAAGSGEEPWKYHSVAFCKYGRGLFGGAGMGVYDVNGDGLNDVVTGLNAHGFGLAWFEQKRDAAGKTTFIQHVFSDDYSARNAGGVTFSEPHGTAFADVDGDGVQDFIVGKRYWSHLDTYLDPDPYGPPVLYWYRTVRNPTLPGGAEFVPNLIHNRSGAGSDVLATDLNKDGAVDIVTSTDRGTFIFWGANVSVAAIVY